MKRVTNLLYLLIGIAALAVGAYSFRRVALGGRVWWRQHSAMVARSARSAKSGSASDDASLSADNLKAYGVLSQPDKAAGGDDGVPAPNTGPPFFIDHVNAADAGAPNHFLHRRMSVTTCQIFAFEVPPRALRPELRGTFRPVATRRNPDGGASMEVLLMNEEEFAGFINHRRVAAMFSSNPSRRGEIDWKLDAPADNPQKYYLVFRNASAGQGPSLVDADFTASFE